MIQIRGNCFETNSSSQHSLVIITNKDWVDEVYSEEELKEGFYVNKNGIWNASNDDWYFGRYPFRILSTFYDKVRYACASGFCNETIEIVKKYIPKIKEVKLPEYMGTDDYQLKCWLADNNISLEEFLTHDKYVIICDGDEYCIWSQMLQSGLINKKVFEEHV